VPDTVRTLQHGRRGPTDQEVAGSNPAERTRNGRSEARSAPATRCCCSRRTARATIRGPERRPEAAGAETASGTWTCRCASSQTSVEARVVTHVKRYPRPAKHALATSVALTRPSQESATPGVPGSPRCGLSRAWPQPCLSTDPRPGSHTHRHAAEDHEVEGKPQEDAVGDRRRLRCSTRSPGPAPRMSAERTPAVGLLVLDRVCISGRTSWRSSPRTYDGRRPRAAGPGRRQVRRSQRQR